VPHSPGAATSSRLASGANTAVFPEPEAPVTMKSGRAVRAQHRPHFARRGHSGRPLASGVRPDFASAHAGRPRVCHKAAARQGRQVTESEVALRWRVPRAPPLAGVTGTAADRDAATCAMPGDRCLVVITGSHVLLRLARAYGPALLFPVRGMDLARACPRADVPGGGRAIPPVLADAGHGIKGSHRNRLAWCRPRDRRRCPQ
jgi:hypothetical protein